MLYTDKNAQSEPILTAYRSASLKIATDLMPRRLHDFITYKKSLMFNL